MKLLAMLLPVLSTPLFAADWRQELTPPTPGKFPAPQAQVASYRFGWGAIPAATGEFEFSRTKGGNLRLKVDTRTSGAVRAMWRMDARHESTCAAGTLRPMSLVQTETYKSKSKSVRANFDANGVAYLRESKPPDKNPPKLKRFDFPTLFDLHTALLFIRSQPLRLGDRYTLVVFPATSAYLARVNVTAPERLKIAGKSYAAIVLEVNLEQIKKDLTLGAHKKFKQAKVWISDDRERNLLKAEAEVFVGSVWAEIVKIEPRPE